MPVRAVCKPHSPDLKRGALATDARGCSLWRTLLERPSPVPESRVRDPLGELVRTRVGGVTLGLTAPIHCRGSIGEQVMQWHISPNCFQRRIKLIYILGGPRVSTSANIHLRVNYSFNNVLKSLEHKHYLYIIHGTLDIRVSAFI